MLYFSLGFLDIIENNYRNIEYWKLKEYLREFMVMCLVRRCEEREFKGLSDVIMVI